MKGVFIKLQSEKKFGYFFAVLFLIVSIFVLKSGNLNIFYLCLIVSCFFLMITIFNIQILYWLNKYWMKLSVLISKINNPLIMGLLFFGFLTPFALLLKAFKRDELRLKPVKSQSFWIASEKVKYDLSFFKNQF
jgi:hypothetical protein